MDAMTARLIFLVVLAIGVSTSSRAHPPLTQEPPPYKIAIIIDDLGDKLAVGKRVIDLPGDINCSFIPFLDHTAELAQRAWRSGKEVMLHMPMQAQSHPHRLEGGLTLEMDQQEVGVRLQRALSAVPHVAGVNNHMGSLLTTKTAYMRRFMAELIRSKPVFFVDSFTIHDSIALQVAQELGIPSVRRHVFLDHDPSLPAITAQFERLLRLARAQGYAIAIGHPHGTTLSFLEEWLPRLDSIGFELVPVSWLTDTENSEYRLWQASLSR